MKSPPRRCAIYTRKSSEEGLEQEFNSLHAQREACEAYIKSQTHEGWRAVATRYDDGGFSGGTIERPALQRLMADVRARRVDVIVVYKVDRLTRSLTDFARIVEVLDAESVSFVSVTQHFNTTSSMGRLTLNVLLSFAQFEREVTGERIRDKFAASRRKGMWMGGTPPLGYDIDQRKLVVNEAEAQQVRTIFERYIALGSVAALAADLRSRQIKSKRWVSTKGTGRGGCEFGRGALYALVQNRIYLGEAVHKGTAYPGEHEPIVSRDVWDRAQLVLGGNRRDRRPGAGAPFTHLLSGLLFDDRGNRMSPSHAKKRDGRRYRYYVSQPLLRGRPPDKGSIARVPAHDVEDLVQSTVLEMLSPQRAGADEMSPAETAHLVRMALRRVEIRAHEIEIAVDKNTVGSRDLRRWPVLDGRIAVEDDLMRITIPVSVKRCGGQRVIVTSDGRNAVSRGRPDRALIKALSRARTWLSEIEQGRIASPGDLAGHLGIEERYVQKILKLAFLAPDLVETILDGTQLRKLTLASLIDADIPASWPKQRQLLAR